jgi:hypothetical protein
MGAVAWGLWPTLRFPSPLIEADVSISGIQLIEAEVAFKTVKDDPRSISSRIEAPIFVAFLAYCLHVTLRAWLEPLALGLTNFPTGDGRILSRRPRHPKVKR